MPLGQSRGDYCYWKNLQELFSSVCWQFLSWSFVGFSVSLVEALCVPGCQKWCSPALPSTPAKQCHPSTGHSIPGIFVTWADSFWHMATAEVHCRNQIFWPEFLFLTFRLIGFYFILQLVKCRVLKWRLGVLEKSCTVSCVPVPEVSFWGRSVIRHETGNTSSHLMGFSLIEEQRY